MRKRKKLYSVNEIHSRTKEIVLSPSTISPVSTSAISPAPSQEADSPVDYSKVFQYYPPCPLEVPAPVPQDAELYEQVLQPLPDLMQPLPDPFDLSNLLLNSVVDPLWDSISLKLFEILTNGEFSIPQGTAARFLLDLGEKWQLEDVVGMYVTSMFEKTPVSVLQHVYFFLSYFGGNFHFLDLFIDSIL